MLATVLDVVSGEDGAVTVLTIPVMDESYFYRITHTVVGNGQWPSSQMHLMLVLATRNLQSMNFTVPDISFCQ